MKDKYKRFKRQNMMGYENYSQLEGESSNASQNGSNNLFFSPPTDTYQIMLSEQLEEMFEKNHNHLYHWLNSGQGKKWLEMRI